MRFTATEEAPHPDSVGPMAADEVMIPCIGVDGLLHTCAPASASCKCGVEVRRKELLRDDHSRYSCYECTY